MNYREEAKKMANYNTEIKRDLLQAHQFLNRLQEHIEYIDDRMLGWIHEVHYYMNSAERKAQLLYDNYPNEQTIKLLYKSIELEEQS